MGGIDGRADDAISATQGGSISIGLGLLVSMLVAVVAGVSIVLVLYIREFVPGRYRR